MLFKYWTFLTFCCRPCFDLTFSLYVVSSTSWLQLLSIHLKLPNANPYPKPFFWPMYPSANITPWISHWRLYTDMTRSSTHCSLLPPLQTCSPMFSVSVNDTNISITAHVKNLGILYFLIPTCNQSPNFVTCTSFLNVSWINLLSIFTITPQLKLPATLTWTTNYLCRIMTLIPFQCNST